MLADGDIRIPIAQVSDFFTIESLLTFQGSTLAVLLTTNGIGAIIGDRFHYLRKWVAFGAALCLQGLLVETVEPGRVEWVVAAFNAVLVFAAALGLNEATYSFVSRFPGNPRFERSDKRVFASWLHRSPRWTWGPGR
jgi:hypothetical protein